MGGEAGMDGHGKDLLAITVEEFYTYFNNESFKGRPTTTTSTPVLVEAWRLNRIKVTDRNEKKT